jgi:hypothetical protein
LIFQVIDSSSPSNGKDPEAIQPQDAVFIDFVGRLAETRSDTDGPIFQEVKGWLVLVGDGDILPCLEMAARFMETGQTAHVWSHSKFAFGPGTRRHETTTQQVPPYANVMFEVVVKQIVMDTSRLNPYFTIQKAITRKTMANDIYQQEWCPPPATPEDPSCDAAMTRAVRLYQKVATEMETLLQGTYFNQVEAEHPQRHQSKQILLDSLNNIVTVQLRQHEYHKAKQSAVEVLKQDGKNLKGLLRAAKAALLDPASTMEEGKAALTAAESEITYKNPTEEKELKRLKIQYKRKQQEYKLQSKAMFADKLQTANALGSAEDEDEEKETTSAESESEPETTTKDISATPSEEEKVDDDDDEATLAKDDVAFWRSQMISILLQVVIPFAIFLLYRMVTKTNRIAQVTLEANQHVSMPILEADPDIDIDIDIDVINLDL